MAIECYRQGDVCFEKIDELPQGLVEKGTILEIHGEEGNTHRMIGVQTLMLPGQEEQLPVVVVKTTASMFHEQHPPLVIPEGIYNITLFQEHENPQRVD